MDAAGHLQVVLRDQRAVLPVRRTKLLHDVRFVDVQRTSGLFRSLVRIRRVAFVPDAKVRVNTKRDPGTRRQDGGGQSYTYNAYLQNLFRVESYYRFFFLNFINNSMIVAKHSYFSIKTNKKESGCHHSMTQGGSFDLPRSYSTVKYHTYSYKYLFFLKPNYTQMYNFIF